MKRIIIGILIFIIQMIIAIAATAAVEQNIQVKVKHIELFRNGAQVYRTVSYTPNSATSELLITQVPSDIDPKTIRARALNSQKITSIEFKTDYSPDKESTAKSAALKDSIEALALEINLKESERTALLEQEQLLKRNQNVYESGLKTEDLQALLEIYGRQLKSIKRETVILANELNQMNKSLSDLRGRLSRSSQVDHPLAGVIHIQLRNEVFIKSQIEVSYLVADAWWKPVYDIRVQNLDSPIEVDYKAEIFQNTGEDWKDVNMVLFVNNPQMRTELPELQTWKLYYGSSTPTYSKPEISQPKSQIAKGSGTLSGTITDASTGEPIPFANIQLLQSGVNIRSGQTNFEGKYEISNIAPNFYDLRASSVGYETVHFQDVRIVDGKRTSIGFDFVQSAVALETVEIVQNRVALSNQVNSTEINRMSARSPMEIAATVGGTYSSDDGSGMLNVRGQRSDANYYYVDGIQVRGSSAIAQKQNDPPIVFKDEKAYSDLNSEIEASEKQTVLSSNESKLVYLQSREISAEYVFRAIPKIDPLVYLYAKLPDWEELRLLSGEANLFYEQTFVGEIMINAQNTVDTLTLSLGSDKNILVKRDQIEDEWDRGTFGNSERKVAWNIAVKSNKKYPVKVIIEDQIPVAKANGFDVKLTEDSDAELDEQSGKLTWEFGLDALESKELEFAYTVRFPNGSSVALE